MTTARPGLCRVLALGALLSGLAGAQEGQVPTAEEIERIRAALPARPTVPPAAPRKVLILTRCQGFVHSSVPYAAKAFELMGQKTGAFQTEITDDVRRFDPDSLAAFDALIMDNTTLRLPLVATDLDQRTPEERQALEAQEQRLRSGLLDFVRNGKGLVGVHAATDCFYDWPEYGELIGAYFSGHPWSETVTIRLEDPGHPLLRAFRGRGFSVNDEIYQFREPYSRETLRVLLTLDPDGTNMNKGDQIRRTDGDFAVAWIREYGKGRVFYFSLGHQHAIFWNRPILQCYLDGIQYALGDLQADATPSARLTAEYLAESRRRGEESGLDATFADLAWYHLGDDASDARRVADLVVEAQSLDRAELRSDLERRLVALAVRADATADARQFACRQLSLIGGSAAVPALAALLADPESGGMARYALERIPGPAADRALLDALAAGSGPALVGLINALGVRRTAAATAPLAELLRSPDAAVAAAAAGALGRIGTPDAAAVLLAAAGTLPDPGAVLHGLLAAAGVLAAAEGAEAEASRALAARLFARVHEAAPAGSTLQAAGFAGLARLRGEAALPDVLAALRQERCPLSLAAAGLVPVLPGAEVAARVAAELPGVPVSVQPVVIAALAERGDRAALSAVVAAAASPELAVRVAAARALERLGDESTALVLARLAAEAEPRSDLQAAARTSLDRLPGPGVDGALVEGLAAAAAPVQREIVRALGARMAVGAVGVLLRMAGSEDRGVASESLASLSELAGSEHLPALVALFPAAEVSQTLSRLEGVVVTVSRRAADPDAGVAAVAAALGGDLSPAARASLLAVLGKLGRPAGLEVLYGALAHPDGEVRKAAIRALADWPDAAPMERLRQVSIESADEAHRVLALRGYARQLAMPSRRPMAETLRLYREAFGLARGDAERRSLLLGLGEVVHPEALALAREFISQESLRDDAVRAAVRILKGLQGASISPAASHTSASEGLSHAIDGNRATRWTTGRPQQGDEWFEIDLGYQTDISEIVLDAGDTGNDSPAHYRVFISSDRTQWGDPVLEGRSQGKVLTLKVPPTPGRYIRIEQLGTSGGMYWSIAELQVDGRPEHLDENRLRLDRSGWVVSASQLNEDAPKAIDGDIKTRWGTGRGQKPGDWFQVDLGQTRTIRSILLDAAQSGSDYPRGYRVEVSDDGQTWTGPIGVGEGEARPLTVIPVLPTAARHVRITQTGDGDHWWWSIYEMQILGE